MTEKSWKFNNTLNRSISLREKVDSSHNYRRAFGSFGDSLTFSQSTVIKMGYKLENTLFSHSSLIPLEDLLTEERFLSLPEGKYFCTKKAIRNSDYCIPRTEPDITILEKKKTSSKFTFIELKLGINFDTKSPLRKEKN